MNRYFLLFIVLLELVLGHVWTQCPAPRGCFYKYDTAGNNNIQCAKCNQNLGTDGDGPWRRKPCAQPSKLERVTPLMAGEEICFRWNEFVAHPGYYRIAIATKTVEPGDDESGSVKLRKGSYCSSI